MSKEKLKTKRGITLIALVITIIVMLILVAVTVTVALNGGLFSTAKKATADTEAAREAESKLSSGKVQIDGLWYNSIEDYVAGVEGKIATYNDAQKDGGYLTENAEFKDGDYTAVIPKGFKVSEKDGENKIETGLVIQDAVGNEFVWIPIKENLGESYSSGSNYLEPKELDGKDSDNSKITDSQDNLNYYYGYTDDTNAKPYYDYNDFKYESEYAEMVRQVNKYHGFYIGRYETTIDESGNIGSKAGEKVLESGDTLVETPYNAESENPGAYRWWGLYAEQKRANVPENGTNVQTAMIYGVLWDKTMDFIRTQKTAGNTTYNVDSATESWHQYSSEVEAGKSESGKAGDVALNIWDLEGNAFEWTQEADWSDCRGGRGRTLRGARASKFSLYRLTF